MISADSFSSESPIWIYQSDRVFTDVECEQITKELKSFLTQWTSHGQTLKAEAHIFHNIFIVFIVESTVELPSGCSIDSSVHLVKELEKSLGVDFFNRLNICYRSDDQLYIHPLSEIKKAVVYGNVLGSFAVEKYGLAGLLEVKKSDINKRVKLYEKMIRF